MEKSLQPDSVNTYYEEKVEPIYRAISGRAMHLGMFDSLEEPYEVGATRTKEFLASQLNLKSGMRVLDLGSGYGEAARFLVQRYDCSVLAINLIHVQNVFARKSNRDMGFGPAIHVIEADFTQVPLASGCASVVWSQEALLHAPDRGQVLKEAFRLLRPGGTLIFTDILQTGPMTVEEARQIYERVKILSLETAEGYKPKLQVAGFEVRKFADLSAYVSTYYQKYIDHLRTRKEALVEAVGEEYFDYTLRAMALWVKAAREGKLGWGMFLAQKVAK